MPPRMRSSSAVRAVSINTGIVDSSSLSALMRFRTPHPSVPGIITSSTTTSGRSVRTISKALSPSGAVRTRCPSRSRLCLMIVRMSSSSSTARTVAIAPFILTGPPPLPGRLLSGSRLGAHPCDPALGLAYLGESGQIVGGVPDLVEEVAAALGLDPLDELLTELVLDELGLDSEQPLD